jgi:transposase InsO family protein
MTWRLRWSSGTCPFACSPCTRSASAGCSRPRPHGAGSSVNEAGADRGIVSTRPGRRTASGPPGELLHIDVTIIKLIDGTRTYLHAVIDNFSRRFLAWKLAASLEPGTTCRVLTEAGKQLPKLDGPATLYADSGVENVNGRQLCDPREAHHVLRGRTRHENATRGVPWTDAG